jgi:hypothetical protein
MRLDAGMDARTDPRTDPASGRWCSYDEVAEMLGITRGGARNLARKRSWARRPGNDGKTRVLVPADTIPARTDAGIDGSTDAHIDPAPNAAAELGAMVARLEGELAGLRVVIEAERRRAELAERLADEVRQDRDRWHKEATARRGWWSWRRSA